jgi:Potential Queuosine, Q, salvage protein family
LLAYVFVVDAMNFCFWPGNPAGNFEYEHMTKNLAKILTETPKFFEAGSLATQVTAAVLRKRVFNDMDFALLEERARIVTEVGTVIHHYYQGSFLEFMKSCKFDAALLVRRITMEFSGFRDEAIYQGRQVFFYKRAQILVADLFGALAEANHQL